MFDYAQFHEAVSAAVIAATRYYLESRDSDNRADCDDIAFGMLHDGVLRALVACTDDLTPLINDIVNVARDAVSAGRSDLHIPQRRLPAEVVGGIPVVGIIDAKQSVQFYSRWHDDMTGK